MKFLYQIFITLYPFVAKLISGKNSKAKLWVSGRKDIMQRLQEAFTNNNGKVVWMHCSSLGEFEQGRPVIEMLKKENAGIKILITFFSPSGYEVKKDYELADWVFYLPMDSAKNASNLYEIVKPSLVLFVKYEFWFYFLKEAKERNIPILLISGIFRESQPFFKWYGKFNRQMLQYFTMLFVQNETSVELLKSIGIDENVAISGDTRFDRVLSIARKFEPIPEIETFIGNHKEVITAGSTWREDDEVLYHYAKTHPHVMFIIAPHDTQESRVGECLALYPNAIRYSEWITLDNKAIIPTTTKIKKKGKQSMGKKADANILIMDNMGMLSRLYKYATICYVGGGFGEDGVHNVLEAAVFGKPVIIGPEYSKFIEAEGLVNSGGAYSVESTIELERIVNKLFTDATLYENVSTAAGDYVAVNGGATGIIIKYIYEKRLLTN